MYKKLQSGTLLSLDIGLFSEYFIFRAIRNWRGQQPSLLYNISIYVFKYNIICTIINDSMNEIILHKYRIIATITRCRRAYYTYYVYNPYEDFRIKENI